MAAQRNDHNRCDKEEKSDQAGGQHSRRRRIDGGQEYGHQAKEDGQSAEERHGFDLVHTTPDLEAQNLSLDFIGLSRKIYDIVSAQ
jgi:hypothetical protein